MIIRPIAVTRHGPAVAAALHDTWWAADGWTLEATRDFLAAAMGPGAPCCVVAERHGDWLGTATLDNDDLSIRPDLAPWLASVWVRPEARGQGVGAALVRHVEMLARMRGHARLWLYTPDRAVFYERLGWRRVGAEAARLGPVVLMSRIL
jgi:GNAT superfamily N-acetyltransferase